ncbi:MAG: DUF3127 domain-containing protein [Bacteroidetes bacterium]|jgi:hypothetical protein|nr:DUF3127 domain-containing protein [Bacteroidota bacterium]
MEAEGRLIEIFPAQQVTATFRKREFVLELGTNNNYPETVIFQLVQDKCDLLDKFEKGDNMVVQFDLKGRKWNSPNGELKYFNSLQAWKIDRKGGGKTQANDLPPGFDDLPFDSAPPLDDDLPF